MTKLEMVKEFRNAFSLPVADRPTPLPNESAELHIRLITDEAGEILDAINSSKVIDRIKIRDVSGDLLYFAVGVLAEAGLDWDEQALRAKAQEEAASEPLPLRFLEQIFHDIVAAAGDLNYSNLVEGTAIELCYYSLLVDAAIDALDRLDSDFALIHAANMRKLWTTEQVESEICECPTGEDESVDFLASDGGCWAVNKAPNNEGRYVVRLNGKVQKPPGWVPAQLEGGAV